MAHLHLNELFAHMRYVVKQSYLLTYLLLFDLLQALFEGWEGREFMDVF